MSLKEQILELSAGLGFQRTVIASLEPLSAQIEGFQAWIDKGFAADMNYLKRDVRARNSPELLLANARSAIVVSISYYSEASQSPGPFFGRVASYAVGLDYHAVLRKKLRELKDGIESAAGRPLLSKAFTDDVQLHERALAQRHGLGFTGKNTLIIGPKLMGSYHFIGELLTDLEIEPDEEYVGTCGNCFRCGDRCPTEAVIQGQGIDANLCISYLTIENKGGIPVELRPKLGKWIFGCDVCQEVCPYNQRPPETPWEEFKPHSGVGHYLDLLSLLEIKDDVQFLAQFQHSALRRPKRRGLLRNALVVLGNCLREANGDEAGVVKHIERFISTESDLMLIEHAQWAINV